ncbi:hypothetical protein L484_013839 [Morus notabilis]|uniref:Uncharacterized protein n=1 Tax=Morus notabilis TaxID=981085 RepID=W9SZ11_9ROSA|nr:hypothetical protein L484_013839 [Morus notabilis]
MGSVISKAADGVGSLLGNAFMAPFKSVFVTICKIGNIASVLQVEGMKCDDYGQRLNSFRGSSGFDVSRHHRRVKLKSREESAHVKGGSSRLRSSRQLQPRKVRSVGKKAKTFKRRRLR